MWYENSDNVKYTVTKCLSASEESLLEAQLQAGGAKICYTQHRSPPSTISSATSSSASVASCGGSTAALINKQNKNKKHQFKVNIHKHKIYNKGSKMNNTTRKELNLLITNPTILVGLDSAEGKDKQHDQSTTVTIPYSEMERDDDRRLSFNGKTQYELENIDEKTSHSINDTVNRTGTYDPNTTQSPGVSLKTVFPQVLAAISVSLCSMVVGFASGYTSPATYSMRQENSTIQITEHQASWIGSIMPLCALIGGIIGGPLIDTIGRKTTILSTAIPFILSFLLIALANGVPMVLTGRAISGLCVGISSLALPVYLGETVQPEVRGALGLLPTTLGNAGILICFVAGKYLDWSNLALLGAVIPVPFLLCMFLIPETPRWFVEKNKLKKARKSLQWLRGKRTDVTNEFSEIEKSNQDVEKNNEFLLTEFFSKKYRRPLLIAIGLMFFQQMSGINALIFYTVSIFKDAGSTIDENLSTIILGVVNMFSTFVATMLIDRLGRKILLYTSSVLMATTLAVLGGFFYFKNVLGANTADYGWVPLMSFVIFVIGFSIGFGPIPWLMLGEILPVKIRGSAAALVTAFNWSCTFIVTKTFTDLKMVIGQHGAFWVFASICFAGLGFTIMSVPETQGKSLEDIERNLTGGGEKVPVRAVRRMSSIANLKPTPMSF